MREQREARGAGPDVLIAGDPGMHFSHGIPITFISAADPQVHGQGLVHCASFTVSVCLVQQNSTMTLNFTDDKTDS